MAFDEALKFTLGEEGGFGTTPGTAAERRCGV